MNFIDPTTRGETQVYILAKECAEKIDASIPFLEIGTQSGYSAMDTLRALCHTNRDRWFISIDPYGLKPYKTGETVLTNGLDYDEEHYRCAMYSLHSYAFNNELNYVHYRMLSEHFMNTYDAMEFWYDGGKLKKQFGFVYLDGDHDIDSMINEYNWFKDRMVPHGVILIDDVHLVEKSWELFETYIKDYEITESNGHKRLLKRF